MLASTVAAAVKTHIITSQIKWPSLCTVPWEPCPIQQTCASLRADQAACHYILKEASISSGHVQIDELRGLTLLTTLRPGVVVVMMSSPSTDRIYGPDHQIVIDSLVTSSSIYCNSVLEQ